MPPSIQIPNLKSEIPNNSLKENKSQNLKHAPLPFSLCLLSVCFGYRISDLGFQPRSRGNIPAMPRLAPYVLSALAVLSLLLCTTLCAHSVDVHHPFAVGCLMVLPIALPTAWVIHYYRQLQILRHRATTGRCLTCGYDLRATPACCPECGRTPDAALTDLRAKPFLVSFPRSR